MQNLYTLTLTHSINTNSFGINAEKQHSLKKSKQNITATTLHEAAAADGEKEAIINLLLQFQIQMVFFREINE